MTSSEHRNALPMTPVDDVSPSRVHRTKTVYADTVEAFLEGDAKTVKIDLDVIDIKPATLRAGLTKAIADLGKEDEVEFSIRPSIGVVYLMKK